jgi:GTP cyclohydrolase II
MINCTAQAINVHDDGSYNIVYTCVMSYSPQATAALPTRMGDFTLHIFTDNAGAEHMALVKGTPADDVLVRVHSECATGDILGSLRCDCRDQLEQSLQMIRDAGHGIFIYLRGHEGRGIGLANKIRAYALQDNGMDTAEANVALGFAVDQRAYGTAADILRHFGLQRVHLITNNSAKIKALEAEGISVSRRVSLWTTANTHNDSYLATKKTKMGHIL